MAFYGNLTSSIGAIDGNWAVDVGAHVCPLGSTLACAAAALSFAAPPAHQVRPLTETVAAGARHPPSSSGSAWICSFHGKHAGKMMENASWTHGNSREMMENHGKSVKL